MLICGPRLPGWGGNATGPSSPGAHRCCAGGQRLGAACALVRISPHPAVSCSMVYKQADFELANLSNDYLHACSLFTPTFT